MKFQTITLNDLVRTWRFGVPLITFQFIGGLLGWMIRFHHFWFLNLWIGAAIAMIPGLAIGMAWQSRAGDRSERSKFAIRLMTCAGAFVVLMAVLVTLPRMWAEMGHLADVTQLQQESIQRIDVFDRRGRTAILAVTDRSIIADFAASLSDAAGYAPNHERYAQSWYLVVSGPTRREYELHIGDKHPEAVIGDFVVKDGNRTSYHGSFKSRALWDWIERNLLSEN